MAKQSITIKLTFDYDPAENRGIPPHIFLYQTINRLNYEHPVKSIEYKGKTMSITDFKEIKELPLKQVDSIDKADLPPKPDQSKIIKILRE